MSLESLGVSVTVIVAVSVESESLVGRFAVLLRVCLPWVDGGLNEESCFATYSRDLFKYRF